MHKESTSSSIPIWLAQTRRRVFCSSYNQDKSISTFLGRPIRITSRHTDIQLPLDLRDDELTGDPEALATAISRLDPAGWNTNTQHLRASWIRLRHISSRLREEILDLSSSTTPLTPATEHALLDISSRIRSSWASVPAHMRYWPTCWDEALPSSVCLMLVVIHLTHWYNEFMIQKLLSSNTPLVVSNPAMLSVSMDLLSGVLALGAIRDRTYDIHRDLLNCILMFGIPSASVLATALKAHSNPQNATSSSLSSSSSSPTTTTTTTSTTTVPTPSAFPAGIKKAPIIRALSVLISHLDAAAHLENSGARVGEANYALCRRASRIFARVIEHVLDPPETTATATTSSTPATATATTARNGRSRAGGVQDRDQDGAVHGDGDRHGHGHAVSNGPGNAQAEFDLEAELGFDGMGLGLDLFGMPGLEGLEGFEFGAAMGVGVGVGVGDGAVGAGLGSGGGSGGVLGGGGGVEWGAWTL